MASKVIMRNERGDLKEGFIGWSWTTFFFGCLPALFRGDFGGFFVIFASAILAELGITALGIPELAPLILLVVRILWSANYNGWHLERLKARGFAMVNGGA